MCKVCLQPILQGLHFLILKSSVFPADRTQSTLYVNDNNFEFNADFDQTEAPLQYCLDVLISHRITRTEIWSHLKKNDRLKQTVGLIKDT